jgi:hypothetical protein
MPTPLPTVSEVLLHPPDAAEVAVLARGITTAVAPDGGLTHLQNVLITAVSESMTGHTVDLTTVEPISAVDFAAALRAPQPRVPHPHRAADGAERAGARAAPRVGVRACRRVRA